MNGVESKPETTGVSESAVVTTEKLRRLKRGGYRLPRDAHARLRVLRRAVRTLGGRVLDGRTRAGRGLAAWRTDLANDLGGAAHRAESTGGCS